MFCCSPCTWSAPALATRLMSGQAGVTLHGRYCYVRTLVDIAPAIAPTCATNCDAMSKAPPLEISSPRCARQGRSVLAFVGHPPLPDTCWLLPIICGTSLCFRRGPILATRVTLILRGTFRICMYSSCALLCAALLPTTMRAAMTRRATAYLPECGSTAARTVGAALSERADVYRGTGLRATGSQSLRQRRCGVGSWRTAR